MLIIMITSNDNKESEKIKSRLVSILKDHPQGLTIKELSDMIKLHRQTITKYIFELKGAGLVHRRRVGSATLHYLIKSRT